MKEEEEKLVSIFDILKEAKELSYGSAEEQPLVYLEDVKEPLPVRLIGKKAGAFLSREDLHHDQQVLDTLEKYVMDLGRKRMYRMVSLLFPFSEAGLMRKKNMTMVLTKAAKQLEYVLIFIAFAGGQELVGLLQDY